MCGSGLLAAIAADSKQQGGEPMRTVSQGPMIVAAANRAANKPLDPMAKELERRLAKDVAPLMDKYCYSCHGNGKRKGGVTLDGPGDIATIMAKADDWHTVVDVLNTRLMPPEDKPQPTAAELLTIQEWVADAAEYYPADAEPDPGWATIHRLNRSEYRNTMRDLLGIDPAEHDLSAHLPADDTGYGFDNIADVLSMSPLQFEKFLDAAEQAVTIALGPDISDQPKPLRNLKASNIGEPYGSLGHTLWANGTLTSDFTFPADGTYTLTVKAYGSRAENVGPKIDVQLDGQTLQTFDITARRGQPPQTITLDIQAQRGRQTLGVAFINDAVIDGKDRNLWVESITVAGPIDQGNASAVYGEVFFVQPTADDQGNRLPGSEGRGRITESQAARQVLERFASRAFRRTATAGDVAGLLRVYKASREQGQGYEPAVKLAITAALVSPNFLYRPIANPRSNDPSYIYTLSDDELASRLSYFLWSSMPDDRLLELARTKRLNRPEVLTREVRRMIADPKADAMVENFAGQWLLLRKLDGLEMDPAAFPAFSAQLRGSMREEAELFFADVMRSDRSVLTFLDSERAFLNETLAEHYGIDGVKGAGFRPVTLPADSPRGGVLTMAATLTVTSHATRTSPVKRGDYVLGQLMGTAPPPPPPDVPPLELVADKLAENATLREQLAAHVANPTCAGCHKRLDPIGLAMENFDAIGAWRDSEQGQPIDASGELPGGISFTGPVELKQVMLSQSDRFVDNFARKLLTYAIGRGIEPFDRPTIQQITQASAADNHRMQTIIEAVVLSDAFRKARGRETQP